MTDKFNKAISLLQLQKIVADSLIQVLDLNLNHLDEELETLRDIEATDENVIEGAEGYLSESVKDMYIVIEYLKTMTENVSNIIESVYEIKKYTEVEK